MREILFYRTKSDECPVEDFLDTLDGKQATKSSLGNASSWGARKSSDNLPQETCKHEGYLGNPSANGK